MSPKYRIFETERFINDLKLLARGGRGLLEEKLEEYVYPQLRIEPHYGQNIRKLRNWAPDTWRYRIGDWRFFYIINEEIHIVYMIAVSHRKDAYR